MRRVLSQERDEARAAKLISAASPAVRAAPAVMPCSLAMPTHSALCVGGPRLNAVLKTGLPWAKLRKQAADTMLFKRVAEGDEEFNLPKPTARVRGSSVEAGSLESRHPNVENGPPRAL